MFASWLDYWCYLSLSGCDVCPKTNPAELGQYEFVLVATWSWGERCTLRKVSLSAVSTQRLVVLETLGSKHLQRSEKNIHSSGMYSRCLTRFYCECSRWKKQNDDGGGASCSEPSKPESSFISVNFVPRHLWNEEKFMSLAWGGTDLAKRKFDEELAILLFADCIQSVITHATKLNGWTQCEAEYDTDASIALVLASDEWGFCDFCSCFATM